MGAPIDAYFAQGELLEQKAGHGRTFLILTGPLSGKSFVGMLEMPDASVFDPAMLFGKDPRGKCFLNVLKPADDLDFGVRIKHDAFTFKVVDADPDDPSVDRRYTLEVVTAKDA